MNEEVKPKNSIIRVISKNYWISAAVCFVASGSLNQAIADTEDGNESVIAMLLVDVLNVAFVVFLIAAIRRQIKSAKKKSN
jgi:uncharacterized protein with PQ loop repeat